eukprot:GHVR01059624.1.p1 GENE.GHVR01059624.1~~GHVR01059624.1.p1  ORF type:complete len:256 (-),score=132.89 GHVR01059624.1:34-801(-)
MIHTHTHTHIHTHTYTHKIPPDCHNTHTHTHTHTHTLEVIDAWKAYTCVGAATAISALLGNSPVIVYLESAAAVQQGGRTGFTACVCGCLFTLSLLLEPLVSCVPKAATAPILVFSGSLMMAAAAYVSWGRICEGLPAFLCIALMSFSCSITNGILVGVSSYLLLNSPFFFNKVLKWEWLKQRLHDYDTHTNTHTETHTQTHTQPQTYAHTCRQSEESNMLINKVGSGSRISQCDYNNEYSGHLVNQNFGDFRVT